MDNMKDTFGYLWKQRAEVCLRVFLFRSFSHARKGQKISPTLQYREERNVAAGARNGNGELRQVKRQRKKDVGIQK